MGKTPAQIAKAKYDQELKARNRAAYFAGKSCVRCGTTEDLRVDHIDASTKVTHNVFSWSPLRREAELAKCQVLCLACHKIKTIESGDHNHGTKHYKATLNQTQVLEIRRRALTERQKDLAIEFAVSTGVINRLVLRKSYRYI